MKTKLIFKSIFLLFLIVVFICLLFVTFDKTGTRTVLYVPNIIDYKLVNESDIDECLDINDEIYRDNKYIYTIHCIKSDNIYVVWEDGIKDPLKFAIDNEKVNMESLEEHGLKVYRNEI